MFQINNCILISNGKELEFRTPVTKAVEVGDVIAVRLKIVDRSDSNNIYGVRDGRIIWRIQDQAAYHSWISQSPMSMSGFHAYGNVDIYEKDHSLLIATDGVGFRFLVDPATGELLEQVDWVR